MQAVVPAVLPPPPALHLNRAGGREGRAAGKEGLKRVGSHDRHAAPALPSLPRPLDHWKKAPPCPPAAAHLCFVQRLPPILICHIVKEVHEREAVEDRVAAMLFIPPAQGSTWAEGLTLVSAGLAGVYSASASACACASPSMLTAWLGRRDLRPGRTPCWHPPAPLPVRCRLAHRKGRCADPWQQSGSGANPLPPPSPPLPLLLQPAHAPRQVGILL